METSGSNSLNRSMQNSWAAHRRTRVNLNSPAPPVATNGSTTDAPTPSEPPDAVQLKRKTRSTADGSVSTKRARVAISNDHSPPSTRLADLGGVSACVEQMLKLVALPLCHPEVYLHTGVQPPRGVLLHGPPGCGKTLLANAIAGELQVPFINVAAPTIVSGMSGESEKTLRDTFEEAKRVAPCLLFIDEIDAITPKRESAQREMERRIVAQFLTCMDELAWEKTDNKPVIVIGATNRPDSLDAALRRAGRFDHEISMGVPDEEAREQIIRVLSAKLRLAGDFEFKALAKATPGYVGADLAALTGAAGVIAVKRIFQQLSDGTLTLPSADAAPESEMQVDASEPVPPPPATEQPNDTVAPPTKHVPFANLPDSLASNSIALFLRAHPDPLTPTQLDPLHITNADFVLALQEVQPSSKREGFATVPDVTWSDIGALHGIRDELHMAIVEPIQRPELFVALGIAGACGVLLWGPPGCGKTLLAKAVANESRANFISVKGPELLNKYVGESERAVRQVFSRARASAPCVIFFDEIDALVPRRDDALSEASSRVVNTLLAELDGLEARKAVYVIAATNRPDMIDPAMCRPGRLDKLLYVDLPDGPARVEIMSTMLRRVPLSSPDVHAGVEALVRSSRCEGFSGADLAAFVREAGVGALRAVVASGMQDGHASVSLTDFERALGKVTPSVSSGQRRKYEALRTRLTGAPLRVDRDEVKPAPTPGEAADLA
ncbi:ribosome biogenesis ATPase RIX7 [Exidia glandulosa HHB12029]|uniref:Ribosome biogenesis ATPase RIX7 n=1 Tax=Exidia glandulosa HHB12029 TaxID=1314781 RepID=A0A166BS78_EXIGL|nr:ribosome biogenesis ATPase RIX7 [Exidia glandulosa HHB12029]